MEEARKKILEMVAEGKISADDGAKLLAALETGERKEKSKTRSSPGWRMRGDVLDSITETLSEIGPIVQNAMESAMSGFRGYGSEFDIGQDEKDSQELTLKGEPIEPKKGDMVAFRTRGWWGGDLTVEPCDGTALVLSGNAGGVRARRGVEGIFLSWSGGHLKVGVPENVAKIAAKTMGGNISLLGLGCESVMATMGGDLRLIGLTGAFTVKTTGGNIHLALKRSWNGDSAANTMGGNIAILLPASTEACVAASTLGGIISVDEKLGAVDRKDSHGSSKVVLTMGNGPSARISLKTTGGNISIRGLSDE